MQYSYSKLTSFYDCPHAFYRYYQLGEKGIDNPFACYGILVHALLERYAKGELALENLPNEFEASFELEVTEPIKMFGRDLTQSYFDKGLLFFTKFNGFWGLTPLESEYRFSTSFGEDTFIGVIDLVAKNKNGDLIIIDHKSSSKFSKKELKKKARQLYLYAKAINEKYGKFPTEIWFNHFKDNHLEKIKFNSDDYEESWQWAFKTKDLIDGCLEFEPNSSDNFYCSHICNYRKSCDYRE